MARAKKVNAFGDKTYEDVYDSATKEELDYSLKKRLQVPPEKRYQWNKQFRDYHESSWRKRGLSGYDGQGCSWINGCIPSCRYYPDKGRIEDDEIIKQYEDEIAERTKEGTLFYRV